MSSMHLKTPPMFCNIPEVCMFGNKVCLNILQQAVIKGSAIIFEMYKCGLALICDTLTRTVRFDF